MSTLVTHGFGGTAGQLVLHGFGAGASGDNSGTTRLEVEYYMLTVAEINEVTDLTNIFIWEEDAYNFGKVWG